jgi:peptidoglycan/LPS O-acetylase OafA/YrhL
VAAPAIAILGNLTHDHPLVNFGLGMTAANIGIALSIDWCVTHHDGRIGRLLNTAPIVFVGWLSYSLYLWQQPFLNRSSHAALSAFPLNILCAFGLALLSYFLVERPALRLRRSRERVIFAPAAVPNAGAAVAAPVGQASPAPSPRASAM